MDGGRGTGVLGWLAAAVMLCSAATGWPAEEARLEGYAMIQMERGPQNHLVLQATSGGEGARFLVDTGANLSFVRADRAKKLGVRALKRTVNRGGRTFPLGTLDNLKAGGAALGPVEVALLPPDALGGTVRGGGAADGVLGLDLLRAKKAVINCRTRQIFFQTEANARLRFEETTRALGFTALSLEERRAGDLLIGCMLRGRRGKLVVDTGAFLTGIDDDVARRLGLTTKPSKLTTRRVDGRVRAVELAQVDDLRIGSVAMAPQAIVVTDLFGPKKPLRTYTGLGRVEFYAPRTPGEQVFGVLGNDLLDQRRAIIDLGAMRLFLK